MRRPIDILVAGELLVDLITAEFVQTPDEATLFKRSPGGNSAILAMNMARLGNKAMLIACVGNDDMGTVLFDYVQKIGVDTTHITRADDPTTLILATRSAAGSGFQPYRGADFQLSIRQFPFQRFEEISIFHTTCFGMSKKPAQQVILEAAEKAKRAGCQLSLEINYSEKIWPEKSEAQRVVSELCRLGALVKISDTDWDCLYDNQGAQPDTVIDHFLRMGAAEVCLTLGDQGCWVGNGGENHYLPARNVDVKDTTGTGDAFWSGYLTARLDGRSTLECAIAGRRMAEIKLCTFGPLPDKVDRSVVYEDLG